jgi:hypothetical protein
MLKKYLKCFIRQKHILFQEKLKTNLKKNPEITDSI